MFWTFKKKSDGKEYVSWGAARELPADEVTDVKPDFSIKVYAGEEIHPNDSVLFSQQGGSDLGMGDSIWLLNYMRDVFHIKGRGRCDFHLSSSEPIKKFYSNFLPSCTKYREQYITKEEFLSFDHRLCAMFYWHDPVDGKDISNVDNKSIIEHLYMNSGIEYQGMNDFAHFTNDEILYKGKDFYDKFGIDGKYVFFQWHSSGHCKNIPPKTNIKLLKHITEKYGLKVVVIGRLNGLESIEKIPGVINVNNKTTAEEVFSLAFNSEFIVGPDSACCHLAEAYKIPAVIIMGTLTPSYIASKYKIPTFMYGDAYCPNKPCGYVTAFPADRCPALKQNKKYCVVFEEINLELFDRCVEKSINNRKEYRSRPATNFYTSQELPISLYY